MGTKKFKTGDKAKVIDRKWGHRFKIGTIVTLEKFTESYKATNKKGEVWWVEDSELAKVSKKENQMTDIRNDLKIQALEVGIRKQRTTEGLQRLLESNIPEFHEHRFLIRELHRQRREIKHVERMRKSIPLFN